MILLVLIFAAVSMICEVSAVTLICEFGLHMEHGQSGLVGILVMVPLQLFTAVLFDYLHRIQKLLEKRQ